MTMDFDELFGPNRVSEYPDVSKLGDEVASKLEADSIDIIGVYILGDMDFGEVMERLKKAGFEEAQEQSGYSIMSVNGDSLRVTASTYFR